VRLIILGDALMLRVGSGQVRPQDLLVDIKFRRAVLFWAKTSNRHMSIQDQEIARGKCMCGMRMFVRTIWQSTGNLNVDEDNDMEK
jgi:hypothetical protein